MRFQKFYTPEGEIDCIVNLDTVVSAKPTDDGKIILNTGLSSVRVDMKQFEDAILAKDDRMVEIQTLVTRLIQAMDRMTVHFPTSIRMHM